jgi:hypothetical protein
MDVMLILRSLKRGPYRDQEWQSLLWLGKWVLSTLVAPLVAWTATDNRRKILTEEWGSGRAHSIWEAQNSFGACTKSRCNCLKPTCPSQHVNASAVRTGEVWCCKEGVGLYTSSKFAASKSNCSQLGNTTRWPWCASCRLGGGFLKLSRYFGCSRLTGLWLDCLPNHICNEKRMGLYCNEWGL